MDSHFLSSRTDGAFDSSVTTVSVETLWDASTQGIDAVVICGVLGPIALAVVLVRIWARRIIQKNNIWIDDWLIILAMIPTIGVVIGTCLATIPHEKLPQTDNVMIDERLRQHKFIFTTEICWLLATSLVKVSVLCFYRRFHRRAINRLFVWSLWAMICFVIGYTIVGICVLLTSCIPLQATWLQVDPVWSTTHIYACGGRGFKIVLGSIISVVQDLIATLLPFSLLWSLSGCKKEKLIISGICSGGFVVCAVGSWRVYVTFLNEWSSSLEEASRNTYLSYVAASMELLLGIIFSSIPAFKVFVRTASDPNHDVFGHTIFRTSLPSKSIPKPVCTDRVPNRKHSEIEFYRDALTDSGIDFDKGSSISGIQESQLE